MTMFVASLLVRRAFPLLAGLMLACACARPANAVEQATLEAAYLVNFLRYTTWPAEDPDQAFIVVLVGDASIDSVQKSLLAAGDVRGRRLVVRRVDVSGTAPSVAALDEQLTGAHAVYVRTLPKAWADGIPMLPRGRPLLTIGLGRSFASLGGMLGLYTEDHRLVFDANPEAVAQSGLRVSSKVMQLARNLRAAR